MADNGWDCSKGDCTKLARFALRTDRLATALEVCGAHVTWAIRYFMDMHGRPVEPFVISKIAFRREAAQAVPVIRADLLGEAADRIHDRITVRSGSEEHVKDRAVALLREMSKEVRA